ncbi:hypothetical protein Y900_030130 [Mycolicibacterium aromaticivorans JS19b1 = JCM 16368]|uniref:TrbL/VirB6 plasmid conjugal transfer protein n=1 Tax=Mycolicibacterium aromaticivorans JS19b1 = JCM 16368 TaxID=1440774 RepID=A0A064C8F0_9MYCO|nr:hypothetical protein [Mycolicibacterium aromaticivorans]KDE96894.1 hypothetical protein Y900_030130 [Mycolicibacterium aromaticivorans JS19b1 = JCM 16368]
MTELLAAWLYTRPRIRRVWFVVQAIWCASLLAVATAPTATADTLGSAWSFTGLHDSYGVPIGQHFVSLPPLMEMIGSNGPEFGVDPTTWGPAIMSSLNTSMTYAQLNMVLAWETAFLIGVCSVGIWLIKFALGVLWLAWLGAIASPIVDTMKAMIERMHLFEGGILFSIVVGGILCLTTGFSTGIGIILGGFVALLLFWLLLRDPTGELISDNGLLGIGRSLGFSLAQGVVHNGPVAAGGTSAQLDTLTSWMVDVLVRDMVELVNFGQLIDDIPGCASAYNGALLNGSGAAQAVKSCAPNAYAHALHLDATTAGLFFIINCLVLLILWALDYMGIEAFRVGFKAFWNLFIVVPAVAIAAFPGPPRQFAKKAAGRMLLHGAEMMAATAGLGILVLVMASVTRGTLPGTIGMTAPLAKVLVMVLLAVVGSLAFRFALLRAFGDHGIPGPVRVARGGYRAVTGTARTVNEVEYSGRVLNTWRGRLKDRRNQSVSGQGQGEHGGPGAQPPGRKAHPPTSGPGRRNGPDPRFGSAPTPSRPGGGPGSGSGGGVPARGPAAPTSGASATGGQAATRAAATRGAAEVAAPEVAIPVAAAASLRSRARAHHHDSREAHAPARSQGGSPPQNTAVNSYRNRDAHNDVPMTRPPRPDQPDPGDQPPPGRSTPNP